MTIAITIFIKDGDYWRLRNSLYSIFEQTREPDEVIIIDFGSTKENTKRYEAITYAFSLSGVTIKYIKIDNDTDTFHPARMANRAIEETSCDYIITTDIDVVFSRNALLLAEKEFEKGNFVMCARKDLDEGLTPYFKKSMSMVTQVDWIYDLTDVELRKGHGSFQGTSVSWLKANGMYDEKFKGWGFYDMDIQYKAQRKGVDWVWLNEIGMKMIHTYHETLPYRDTTYQKNKDYFFKKYGREQ